MGEYNYSPTFLKANEVMLEKLIHMATSGDIGEARFTNHTRAINFRTLVLNLKRSLALNNPNMAFVHNTLRTTVDYTGKEWVIRVGPSEKIRGGKQLRGNFQRMASTSKGDLPFTVYAGETLRVSDHLSGEAWAKAAIDLTIARSNPSIVRIILERPPNEKGIAYITNMLSPDFEVVTTTPQVVFARSPFTPPSPLPAGPFPTGGATL